MPLRISLHTHFSGRGIVLLYPKTSTVTKPFTTEGPTPLLQYARAPFSLPRTHQKLSNPQPARIFNPLDPEETELSTTSLIARLSYSLAFPTGSAPGSNNRPMTRRIRSPQHRRSHNQRVRIDKTNPQVTRAFPKTKL